MALGEVLDLSPRGIRTHLQLNKPIYAKTSAYGHFGRKPGRDGSLLVGEDRPRAGAEGGGQGGLTLGTSPTSAGDDS